MRITKAITINHPVAEVYAFWRDFENLPRFMNHLQMVETTGGSRSHWTAKAPGGGDVEWDAEITEDRPNELIAWRSVGPNSDVENSGAVQFRTAPGDRGTEVIVSVEYDPPGGKAGSIFSKLLGEDPALQIEDELRRLKQVIETGEVVRSEGSPEGMGRGILKQHPAQPSEDEARL